MSVNEHIESIADSITRLGEQDLRPLTCEVGTLVVTPTEGKLTFNGCSITFLHSRKDFYVLEGVDLGAGGLVLTVPIRDGSQYVIIGKVGNITPHKGDLKRIETLEARCTAIEAVNTTQNGRLDAIEAVNTTQNGRLDALEAVAHSH